MTYFLEHTGCLAPAQRNPPDDMGKMAMGKLAVGWMWRAMGS